MAARLTWPGFPHARHGSDMPWLGASCYAMSLGPRAAVCQAVHYAQSPSKIFPTKIVSTTHFQEIPYGHTHLTLNLQIMLEQNLSTERGRTMISNFPAFACTLLGSMVCSAGDAGVQCDVMLRGAATCHTAAITLAALQCRMPWLQQGATAWRTWRAAWRSKARRDARDDVMWRDRARFDLRRRVESPPAASLFVFGVALLGNVRASCKFYRMSQRQQRVRNWPPCCRLNAHRDIHTYIYIYTLYVYIYIYIHMTYTHIYIYTHIQ